MKTDLHKFSLKKTPKIYLVTLVATDAQKSSRRQDITGYIGDLFIYEMKIAQV